MTMTIDSLFGDIVDCDSHLMPTGEMYETFLQGRFRDRMLAHLKGRADEALADTNKLLNEPDPERVWTTKWWHAYGAHDPVDRVKALDAMGLNRQIVFPTILLHLYMGETETEYALGEAYCDFMLDWAKESNGRLRPVMLGNMHNVERSMRQADHFIQAGADVVQIAANKAPAGLSPAAEEWDPYWARFAEADVPLLFHLGSHRGFFDDMAMQNTPRLRPVDKAGAGEGQGAFGLMTMHFAAEAYLTAMIMGGVFERHPNLKFGVIELGAGWVSSWVERLDHQLNYFAKSLAANIDDKPSFYINRNLRITPFYKEPVGTYIQRDGLDDVYVFSTDYPHAEGGTDPIGLFHGSLVDAGCSDEQIRKFFITNGEALLPPR